MLSGRFVLSGLGFFSGLIRVLERGIGPGVLRILAVSASGSDSLDDGKAWLLRECMGRGGRY